MVKELGAAQPTLSKAEVMRAAIVGHHTFTGDYTRISASSALNQAQAERKAENQAKQYQIKAIFRFIDWWWIKQAKIKQAKIKQAQAENIRPKRSYSARIPYGIRGPYKKRRVTSKVVAAVAETKNRAEILS
jgi:ATPase subunit of ABC transporter with duplicated ATPase domains